MKNIFYGPNSVQVIFNRYGIVFVHRKDDEIVLTINGFIAIFDVVHILEFDSG